VSARWRKTSKSFREVYGPFDTLAIVKIVHIVLLWELAILNRSTDFPGVTVIHRVIAVTLLKKKFHKNDQNIHINEKVRFSKAGGSRHSGKRVVRKTLV
jgi:hypothetical protein